MKNLFFFVVVVIVFVLVGFCQMFRVEIYYIGVGDGDVMFFIIIDEIGVIIIIGEFIVDIVVIFIDGQCIFGGKEVWWYVKEKVNVLNFNRKIVDLIVVLYLYSDYFEGIIIVVSLVKMENWVIGVVVDGQNVDYSYYLFQENIDCYGVFENEDLMLEVFEKYCNMFV